MVQVSGVFLHLDPDPYLLDVSFGTRNLSFYCKF
jgi:hypothetical protein